MTFFFPFFFFLFLSLYIFFAFLSCLFLCFLSFSSLCLPFSFCFVFLLFSYFSFIFYYFLCFFSPTDLRLSCACVVIETTCIIYVLVFLRWQSEYLVFPDVNSETDVCSGLDLEHRRLTPDFIFICFWWRHESRQL